MSLLPIGKNSLKYGTSDAGKTIHFDDPLINKKMKAAGQKLNLKGHYVGIKQPSTKKMWGPADIECHLGQDGRYYVLDFARTFPPEAVLPGQKGQRGQILYKLLRPEFVRNYPKPLSPDAFSGFGRTDPQYKIHEAEVLEATQTLFTTVIPNFVKRLSEPRDSLDSLPINDSLIRELHKDGINVRHLGYVRSLFDESLCSQRQLFLTEMIARIIKNKIRKKWRNLTKKHSYVTIEHCKAVAVNVFNVLFGSGNKTDIFWSMTLKGLIKQKFGQVALSTSEQERGFDLRQSLPTIKGFFFKRVYKLIGIQFTQRLKNEFTEKDKYGQITIGDIVNIKVKIKHMQLIDTAEIQALLFCGLEANEVESERLFQIVLDRLNKLPNLVSFQFESLIRLIRQLRYKAQQNFSLLNSAQKVLELARSLKLSEPSLILEQAKILELRGQRTEALELLQEALKDNSKDSEIKMKLAKLSIQTGDTVKKFELCERLLKEVIGTGTVKQRCRAHALLVTTYFQKLYYLEATDFQKINEFREKIVENYKAFYAINPRQAKTPKKEFVPELKHRKHLIPW